MLVVRTEGPPVLVAELTNAGHYWARRDGPQLYVYPPCDKCDGPAIEIAVPTAGFALWLDAGMPTQRGDIGTYLGFLGKGKGKYGKRNPLVKALHKIAGTNLTAVLCQDCWTNGSQVDLTTPEAEAAAAALLTDLGFGP